MWPVILRELRAGSRRWTTYWLRLLAAGAVVGAVIFWLSHPQSILVRQPGREVFLQMHRVILVAVWIVVPLLTADCLSREKREGTLGLLFLTNLRAWNIVFAKAVAAGLSALTLWLAVIPIITVPVLLGGLPASEIILSCCLALGSLFFALAAGLMASALCNRTSGAVAWAITFSVIGHLVFSVLVKEVQYQLAAAGFFVRFGSSSFGMYFEGLYMIWTLYTPPIPGAWGIAMRAAPAPLNSAVFMIPLFSLLLSGIVALIAAFLVRSNWQDKPKTKSQTEMEKFFCAPVFWTGLFRWWMRRSLERNPIGWLEKRSWSGRITAWIWLAIMSSFASALAYSATRSEFNGFNGLMWMLLASIAYVAAGSFRRERESGALELILVTPLSERQIISGRLRALWNQFLPTFAIWVASVVYLSSAMKDWQATNVLRFAVAYLIVPIVGLYFSLRSRFVLLSWFATLTACFALPQLVWSAFCHLAHAAMRPAVWDSFLRWAEPTSTIFALSTQLSIATFLLWRLHVNLRRRSFSFR